MAKKNPGVYPNSLLKYQGLRTKLGLQANLEFMHIILLVLLLLSPLCARTQPFSHAHAHNDYEHDRPLFDALRYGFTSVEADVFLIDGKLLVSHTRPIFKARTLEQLYLSPLDSIIRANHGKVYQGYNGTFYLMIDIKSDGQATYTVL